MDSRHGSIRHGFMISAMRIVVNTIDRGADSSMILRVLRDRHVSSAETWHQYGGCPGQTVEPHRLAVHSIF